MAMCLETKIPVHHYHENIAHPFYTYDEEVQVFVQSIVIARQQHDEVLEAQAKAPSS